MILSPFLPMGSSFIITTSGTTLTNQSTLVDITLLGLPAGQMPSNIRVRNNDATNALWFSLTPAAGTAAIPTAGTTTVGTPKLVEWVAASSERVFTINTQSGTSQFYLNTIHVSTSVAVWCQLGEGA